MCTVLLLSLVEAHFVAHLFAEEIIAESGAVVFLSLFWVIPRLIICGTDVDRETIVHDFTFGII